MSTPVMGLRVCPDCGRQYFNWCIYCQAQKEVESIPQTMEKFGLSVDNLVLELANQINANSFPALNLAFNLRGINVPKRIEFEGKLGVDSRVERMSDEEIEQQIRDIMVKEGIVE